MRLFSFAAAILSALVLFAPHTATAQGYRGPDIAAQHAAMERLAPLVGNWQGEANASFPVQARVHQTERVERDLDGLLLTIHGIGYATPDHAGDPVFQAMAVISYNDGRQIYEVRAYSNGHATTATAEFLDDGRFQWTIEAGPVRMRYTITFDATTWREAGEMSRDGGATWTPTVDMSLTRVE